MEAKHFDKLDINIWPRTRVHKYDLYGPRIYMELTEKQGEIVALVLEAIEKDMK